VKRINSLKGRNLFREVYGKGKRFKSRGIKLCVLYLGSNNEIFRDCIENKESAVKIGIKAGRKYGKANKRNKAKRRVREILDEFMSEFESGFCFIITPDIDSKNNTFQENREIIRQLLIKAGIIKNAVNK
jgi:ribonuclease P protein component